VSPQNPGDNTYSVLSGNNPGASFDYYVKV
jgi:hypothetical protein